MSIQLKAAKHPRSETTYLNQRTPSALAGKGTSTGTVRIIGTEPFLSGRKDPLRTRDRVQCEARSRLDRREQAFQVEGVRMDEATILLLHGELSTNTVPQLESVLDGLVMLQPLHLVIDLSEVRYVSPEALNTLLWCAIINGDVSLRSPDPATRAEITRRGHARWIEAELVAS